MQNYLSKSPKFILACCLLLILILAKVNSQSSCEFLGELKYLNSSIISMEPVKTDNLSVCHLGNVRTCCNAQIEWDFRREARMVLEKKLNSQITLLEDFYQFYHSKLRDHIRSALELTELYLNRLFEKTYGPFYLNNKNIFEAFFAELKQNFNFDSKIQISTDFDSSFSRLFTRIFFTEFGLLNPLRDVESGVKSCMLEAEKSFRPFGHIPRKITLLLGRSFKFWTGILSALRGSAEEILKISKTVSLSDECVDTFVRMNHCNICAEGGIGVKPCLNYCLNCLRGCLSGLAEIDPQWNLFIDSLIRLSFQLKTVHNPYLALLPVPVQISEGIMHFQENNPLLSTRILLRCFETNLRRKKRQSTNGLAYRVATKRDLELASLQMYFNDGASLMRLELNNFLDRLLRLKRFWRNLPLMFCQEGQIAANSSDEPCWNGSSRAPYQRKLAGDGILSQRFNPEFSRVPSSFDETFVNERLRLLYLRDELEGEKDGSGARLQESASMLPELSPDDEDQIEGSAVEGLEGQDTYESNMKLTRIEHFQHQTTNFSSDGIVDSGTNYITPPHFGLISFYAVLLRIILY